MVMSNTIFAFDRDTIVYTPDGVSEGAVSIEFNGKIFSEPVQLLGDGMAVDPEIQELIVFFRDFYEGNRKGTLEGLLSVWHPDDRADVADGIDADYLIANRTRFDLITDLYLKKVIEYGPYLLCFVRMHFEGYDPSVSVYPVKRENDKLFFSNGLRGDYFFERISPLLDEEDLRRALGQ